MGPIASPSPTSRNQFVSPVNKNRMAPVGQNPPSSPVPNFQHPGMANRPMSVPIQQQRPGLPGQQRPNQSPFSPQSQPPQSPLDMLPESPASQGGLDPFARPPSEGVPDSYVHHSPQTPRSVGHQSPIQTPNRSPAYSGQPMPNPQTAMRINLDTPYAQAPGTPRPQFPGNQGRQTVYARPGEMFSPVQNSPFTSPRQDGFNQPVQEGNRQLRDLLQRQQLPTTGLGQVMVQSQQPTLQSPQPMQPQYMDESQSSGQLQQPQQQPQQQQPQLQQMPNQQLQQAPMDNGTFRQPLPPNMMTRPRMPVPAGGIRPQSPNMVQGPNGPVIRQQIIRTASGGQMLITQPIQQQMMRQRMQLPNRPDGSFVGQLHSGGHVQSLGQPQIGQMSGGLTSQTDQQNIALLAQRLAGEGDAHAPATSAASGNPTAVTQGTSQAQPSNSGEGASEIPDSVSAELEKLEQEDNTGMGEVEGVGDILGGLGDDDDELLDSLTAEMGADFNILEYADPELDTTDGEKSNLLDSLELDEPEGEKSDDKSKPTGDPNKSETMDTDEKVDESKIPRSTAMMQTTVMATSSTVVTQHQLPSGVTIQSQQQMMQSQQMQTMQQQLPLQQHQPQGVGQQQQPTQLQQLISGGQPMGPQSQTQPQQLQQQLLAGQMKTIRPNMLTPAHLQQIQQQMQQQVSYEFHINDDESRIIWILSNRFSRQRQWENQWLLERNSYPRRVPLE